MKPGSRGAASIEAAKRAVEDLERVIDECVERIVMLTAERDAARAQAKSANDAYAAKNETWPNAVRAEAERLTAILRAERDVAQAEVARISEHYESAKRAIADGSLEGTVRTADMVTTLATGTGPVAQPTVDESPEDTPGALRGLQKLVAQHSRTIGDLKDECRALREKIAAMAAAIHAQGKAR